jgi:uncharacterized membrane protein YjjP (DUF1212 family)
MNWIGISLYVALTAVVSLLMMLIFGGGFGTAFITVVALSVGYMFGSYMTMRTYKKQFDDATKAFNE